MNELLKAGLEERLMFESDNADINLTVSSAMNLKSLSFNQKAKIFYENAERFFAKQ